MVQGRERRLKAVRLQETQFGRVGEPDIITHETHLLRWAWRPGLSLRLRLVRTELAAGLAKLAV